MAFRHRFSILILILVLVGWGQGVAGAKVVPADRVARLGKYDNHAMEHLDHLTNDIGPRVAGSHKHLEACEWARDQFEKYGLKNVHLETAAEIPVGFERGPSKGRVESPVSKTLHFITPAWTPGTGGKLEARAVMAPATIEELEKSRSILNGAWVLWRPAEDPEDYMAYQKKWDELDLNVAGVITPSRGTLIHGSGNHRVHWDDLPATPTVVLLEPEWQEIAGMVEDGRTVTLEFDIRNQFKKGPVAIHNVVADIPGSERPDEYVVIGAHIDSHDSGTGAMDNGTGVAATLEAARILAQSGTPPKRTIRFILFGGEELGMLGSNGYVKSHPELMDKISAMYNMDMGADYISGIVATNEMADDFEKVFAPVKALNPEMPFSIERVEYLPDAMTDCGGGEASGSPLVPGGCGGAPVVKRIMVKPGDPIPDIPKELQSSSCTSTVEMGPGMKRVTIMAGSSDHAPFRAAGVPALMWKQKGKNPVPYYLHTQKDTYENVVPSYLEHSAAVIALAALGTANLDHMLSRKNLTKKDNGAHDGPVSTNR
jgi:carboxypeptidase Q